MPPRSWNQGTGGRRTSRLPGKGSGLGSGPIARLGSTRVSQRRFCLSRLRLPAASRREARLCWWRSGASSSVLGGTIGRSAIVAPGPFSVAVLRPWMGSDRAEPAVPALSSSWHAGQSLCAAPLRCGAFDSGRLSSYRLWTNVTTNDLHISFGFGPAPAVAGSSNVMSSSAPGSRSITKFFCLMAS